MATCVTFSEQLLDFLYDLLNEEDSAKLRLHLQACPQCQAELREAEGHQQLLSQAARACKDVPVFAAPDLSTPLAEPASAPAILPTPLPGPLPGQPQVRRQRFPRWLRYGSVALAASVLLGVVFSQEMYRAGLDDRHSQVAEAKKALAAVDAGHAQAKNDYEKQKKAALHAGAVVQVNMTGSPRFDPDAGLYANFAANDLDGNLQDAHLNVQVVDVPSKKVLYETNFVTHGENNALTVPPGLQAKELRLVVTAPASPPLIANLRATEPVYVTHLALNKASYYVRELLFFRTVTLEQFSLRPAATDIPLRFSLVNAAGNVCKHLTGKTGPGGVAGGEFALTDDLLPGSYFLEAAPLTGGHGVAAQRRRVEILSPHAPYVVLDRQQYLPGDVAQGTVYGPNMVPMADQRVIADVVQPGNGAAAGNSAYLNSQAALPYSNQAQKNYSDKNGSFKVAMPDNLGAGRAQLNFGIRTRTSMDNVSASIIVPSRVVVDFFPEGGDLVDGVATQVYYRVRSEQGDPVVPDGRVIVASSKKVEYESPPGQAAGVFSLTPSIKERYTVRLSSARSRVVHANPFEKLGIQTQGLVLAVPKGVVPGNEPVQARLTIKGEAKRLLVLVTCRGQIVEQQTFLANEGETKLELKPLAGLAGILRVSVYEVKNQAMIPLAERLVYRMPAQRLELAGAPAGIHAGRNTWHAQWVNEKRQPVDCYALAAVVDAQFANDGDRDLGTHFYLDSEAVSPAELENANVLVRDTPESREALNLFLATQGWRRFVADAGPEHLAQAAELDKKGKGNREGQLEQERKAADAGTAGTTGLVSLQNAPLAALQAQDQLRMNDGLKRLHAQFVAQARELTGAKENLLKEYYRRALTLAEYERLPGEYLRRGLNLAVLLGFAIAGLLILFGLVRLLRRQIATPVFAGSIAALGACLILGMVGGRLGPNLPNEPKLIASGSADWTDIPFIEVNPNRPRPQTQLLGPGPHSLTLAAAAPRMDKDEKLTLGGSTDAVADPRKLLEAAAFSNQRQQDGLRVGYGNYMYQNVQNQNVQNQNVQNLGKTFGKATRFEDATLKQEVRAARVPAAPMASGAGGMGRAKDGPEADVAKGAAKKGAAKNKDIDALAPSAKAREYAFAPNNPQDRADLMPWATILWSPALQLKNGDLKLTFDLPELPQQSSYRLIIQTHTDDGRLGYFEKILTPAGPPPPGK